MAYRVHAQNFATEHENRIHSDEMAQRYGFTGALVPGVAVYGHLTYPLVERFGERWLATARCEVRLRKPAYDGDELRIELHANDNGGYVVTCDARGERLAEITGAWNTQEPAPPATLANDPKTAGRPTIEWATVVPEQPFNTWSWQADAHENEKYCSEIKDAQDIYREFVHPHWLLSQANRVLTREFTMPAWIHASSGITHHHAVRVGDELTVRSVPLEKWRRKGHEFIRVYSAYSRGDRITTEIEHTAIFKVAA